MDEELSYISYNRQQATEPRGSLLFFVNILFVRLSFNSYVLLKLSKHRPYQKSEAGHVIL